MAVVEEEAEVEVEVVEVEVVTVLLEAVAAVLLAETERQTWCRHVLLCLMLCICYSLSLDHWPAP